jgi:hypothetical protein
VTPKNWLGQILGDFFPRTHPVTLVICSKIFVLLASVQNFFLSFVFLLKKNKKSASAITSELESDDSKRQSRVQEPILRPHSQRSKNLQRHGKPTCFVNKKRFSPPFILAQSYNNACVVFVNSKGFTREFSGAAWFGI